jgi:hypothetical protein
MYFLNENTAMYFLLLLTVSWGGGGIIGMNHTNMKVEVFAVTKL